MRTSLELKAVPQIESSVRLPSKRSLPVIAPQKAAVLETGSPDKEEWSAELVFTPSIYHLQYPKRSTESTAWCHSPSLRDAVVGKVTVVQVTVRSPVELRNISIPSAVASVRTMPETALAEVLNQKEYEKLSTPRSNDVPLSVPS